MKFFVSETVAKLAKKYGFDEPCLTFGGDDVKIGELLPIDESSLYSNSGLDKNFSQLNPFAGPTFEQLRMWFVKKHGIWVETAPLKVSTGAVEGIRYTWGVYSFNNEDLHIVDETPLGYLDFFEAYNIAFENAFKLMEKQKKIDEIIKSN